MIRFLSMTALLAASCAPCLAHQVSIVRGTAVVHSDRLAVVLHVPGEDLLHWCPPKRDESPDSEAWLDRAQRQRGAQLCTALILRNEAGDRLPVRLIESNVRGASGHASVEASLRDVQVRYTLECRWASAPRLIAFQCSGPEPAISLASQTLIAIRVEGGEQVRTVALTSRGNIEALPLCWNGSVPAECPGADASTAVTLTEIGAAIRVSRSEVQIEIAIPLPLLETWAAVPREGAARLLPDEQSEACELFKPFVREGLRIESGGEPCPLTLTSLSFRPICDAESSGDCRPMAFGALTCRLHASYRAADCAPGPVRITWGFFNNAVLTSDASVHVGERTFVHRFSTYDAALVIMRPN